MQPPLVVEGNPVHLLVLGLTPHAVERFDVKRVEQGLGQSVGRVAIGQRRNQNRAKCLKVGYPAQFLQQIAPSADSSFR